MSEIRFFCPGVPAPGGSKTGFAIKKGGQYTGRVAIIDAAGKRNKEWRQRVACAAMNAMKHADLAPMTGPIEAEFIFQMPRPKSHYGARRYQKISHVEDPGILRPHAPPCHITRPDVLKLARSTEDALTGICYGDDSQIVKETIEKFYSDQAGAWIILKLSDERSRDSEMNMAHGGTA